MMRMHQRYEEDPAFRNLVDTMYVCIQQGQFTPTEIREAAMLAQIRYEDRHPRPTIFTAREFMEGKV